MLIPRFSLRWLLGLTTISALVSLVLSYAVRGQAWALGITAGLWCLVIVAFFYVAAFLAAWLIAQVLATFRSRKAAPSPFAPLTNPSGENPFGPAASATIQPPTDSPPALTG